MQRKVGSLELDMGGAPLGESIIKLAVLAEEAGFSIPQLIALFEAGMEMDAMLDLISWRLKQPSPLARVNITSEWIV